MIYDFRAEMLWWYVAVVLQHCRRQAVCYLPLESPHSFFFQRIAIGSG